ncbi:hypothetical protein AWRI1631_51960 [Saccharomyces cerevisiae AWRI1631]|uniref:Uncharacterized protein n=1 Tax=Saccharomyces cerevisiae (strain AWRI1631) TaxID=545124 RepID=B5VHQ7_YEAS6|nr:hypothetical protein AWRI1631_51960 [Saccharomyces cerevisiae AWRI1631]
MAGIVILFWGFFSNNFNKRSFAISYSSSQDTLDTLLDCISLNVGNFNGSFTIFSNNLSSKSEKKGSIPKRRQYKVTPTAQISIMNEMQEPRNKFSFVKLYLVNASSPKHISGAKNAGVPTVLANSNSSKDSLLSELFVLLAAKETPKSEILTVPSPDINKLAGLISR